MVVMSQILNASKNGRVSVSKILVTELDRKFQTKQRIMF